MNRFYTTSLAATLVFAMSASVGLAQQSSTFDQYGVNKGDDIDFETFQGGFDEYGLYDSWDADEDGMLTRDEFNRGVFDSYDADRDGMLNEDEVVGMHEDRLFADETVKGGGAETVTQD